MSGGTAATRPLARQAASATGAALDAHVIVRRDAFTLDARVTAAPGEVVALMGPSGAGKSTLLGVLSGLLRTREGHVRLDGVTVSGATVQVPPQRRGVVLLGQEPRLFPHLSARDNVAFALHRRGRTSRAAIHDAADAWLHRVGLGDRGAHRPRALSGGEQQRVALARALAAGPRVLLLDEPLSALDPATAADIRAVLAAQLAAAGATALIVTHAVVDAVALGDRLVLLENGRVTQSGAPREILTAPQTAFGAAIAGVTRVVGRVEGGVWRAGRLSLPAPACPAGAAIATIASGAVALLDALPAEPPGRVVWTARVTRIDATPNGARMQTADPDVAVDIAAAAFAQRRLSIGDEVMLALDPDGVRIAPEAPPADAER